MRTLWLTVSIASLLFSCKQKEKEQPVTKEEALALAKAIDSSIRYKKPYYFTSLINEKSFADRVSAISGKKINDEIVNGIRKALRESEMGDKIIQSLQENGTYELVKHYEKDNKHHLIFRLFSDDGLNYHDFEIIKRDGKTGVGDMFIYLSGENLSKTIADIMNAFVNGGDFTADMKDIQNVRRLKEAIERRETQKGLNIYNKLPDNMKNQKSVRLLYLLLSSQMEDEVYVKAINDFQIAFPGEANMHLMLIDSYILRKEFTKAISSIDSVDRIINTDPFLDYMRALVYNLADDRAEAINHLERLHKTMPDFDDGALELIASYVLTGDNDKARLLVKEYRQNKRYDQAALDTYLSLLPAFTEED